jgi:hypothetical protein
MPSKTPLGKILHCKKRSIKVNHFCNTNVIIFQCGSGSTKMIRLRNTVQNYCKPFSPFSDQLRLDVFRIRSRGVPTKIVQTKVSLRPVSHSEQVRSDFLISNIFRSDKGRSELRQCTKIKRLHSNVW